MRIPLLLGALALLAAPAFAGGMALDDLKPGTTVHGAALSLDEMRGKVVYVEYWGTH
ncbi:MAG: hypothetical protein HYZ53_17070 [Planctomycetes bacterium]|nr:hypothetical protein [Planctomycetota bacterium]